jgi:hypothetical protein
MDVVDLLGELVTDQSAAQILGAEEKRAHSGYLGSNEGPLGVDAARADGRAARRRDRRLHGGPTGNTDKLPRGARRAL